MALKSEIGQNNMKGEKYMNKKYLQNYAPKTVPGTKKKTNAFAEFAKNLAKMGEVINSVN